MTEASTPAHRSFSPGRLGAIAHNTLLELVRLRVFSFLLLFALLVIGSSVFTVQFSLQNQFQVLKDVGLGAASIFSWLLGLFCTAFLLPKDTEDRTLYTILAKPVSRLEYLLGKLLGVYILLAIALAAMALLFSGVLGLRLSQAVAEVSTNPQLPPEIVSQELAKLRASAFQWNLVPGFVLIYLKAILLATLTLLISTFASSSVFTMLVSVAVYFIGHVQGLVREVWLDPGTASPLIKVFVALLALLFPDLQLFNVVDEIALGTPVPALLFWKISALGLLYTGFYLLMAHFLFSSKEL
jgi:hypothetical protein